MRPAQIIFLAIATGGVAFGMWRQKTIHREANYRAGTHAEYRTHLCRIGAIKMVRLNFAEGTTILYLSTWNITENGQ